MRGALLNPRGSVGKTRLAPHLAAAWGAQGRRVTVVDANPQGSTHDRPTQRATEAVPCLFGVTGLARDTVNREAPELASDADPAVDAPSQVAGLLRLALLTADLIPIPAQPSPFDGRASAMMLKLLEEARIVPPRLVARFVPNPFPARTVIAPQTAGSLADYNPPMLASRIDQRVAFADAARTGRRVYDLDTANHAAREIAALAAEVEALAP